MYIVQDTTTFPNNMELYLLFVFTVFAVTQNLSVHISMWTILNALVRLKGQTSGANAITFNRFMDLSTVLHLFFASTWRCSTYSIKW